MNSSILRNYLESWTECLLGRKVFSSVVISVTGFPKEEIHEAIPIVESSI